MIGIKTYFLTPGWSLDANSIVLGSIITNPSEPQLALFKPAPGDVDSPINATEDADFTSAVDPEMPGLFGTFLRVFGLGDEPSFHYDRTTVLSYSYRQLHSQWFVPSQGLKLKAVAQTNRVAQFARASGYEASVYMVTGLKTVKGACVTTTSGKGKGWRISLSVNADGTDVAPTVFAIKLTELKLSADGKISSADFRDGPRLGGDANADDSNATEQTAADVQGRLDKEFDEAVFTVTDGYDEEDNVPCRIIAPNPACIDLLTAGSARMNPRASFSLAQR
ncbi:hypothetical protein B0H63DRAFT_480958 [Podospora didyma]|uniref:Uncharacterized protein n=1 Tax=Podospora didyma TaxID=330526 RepID=A0AAE0N942_9PEZI|nr:hypothetical protein B0H63DRAFT_480958 [Podospora didyma]